MEARAYSPNRQKRQPKPLDKARLDEIALAYVARFATSAGKLEQYLHRKIRERGWQGDAPADPAAVVARFVELGYIDDTAFARAKSGGLLRRGYGQGRVRQALGEAGIAAEVQEEVAAGEGDRRRAALALARKRRFGPFGAQLPDRPVREKQLAAMLRAGHPLDFAREMVNAASTDAAEQWAAEAEEDENRES